MIQEKKFKSLGVRNMTLLEAYGLIDSYRHAVPGTKAKIEKGLYFGDGFPATLCHHEDDRKHICEILEEEIRNGKHNKEFFDNLDDNYRTILRKIRVKFKDLDLKNESNDDLIDFFNLYYKIYIATFHPMLLAIYVSDLYAIFKSDLSGLISSRDNVPELTAMLLTPTRLTAVQKEEQILFEIRELFTKSGKKEVREEFEDFVKDAEIIKKLQELEDNHGSFHMEYIGEPWKKKDYIEHIWKTIEELKLDVVEWKDQISPKERLNQIILQQESFFENHECSDFFKDLVYSMQEFLIVLDYTKEDVIQGIYFARPLLNEIALRLGLDSWIEVRFLLPDEIKNCLKTESRADEELISERMKNYCVYLERGEITVHNGIEAREFAEERMIVEDYSNLKELKGLTTYPGKVEGKVCVVTSAKDRDKFERGRILVTSDTTTELTSIIKKSKGIVADQGALLSHTGIVSREFKIPCIVQTRIATKIFKDNDSIEIDADNGVVRKLEEGNE